MEKEFVFYKEALALKELGFDEPCFRARSVKSILESSDTTKNSEWSNNYFVAQPTWSSAFDWFEREFNLYSSNFHSFYECFVEYGFFIHTLDGRIVLSEGDYPTSLEAKISCLKKLIEIAKKKKKY